MADGRMLPRDQIAARWGAPPAVCDTDLSFIDGCEPPSPCQHEPEAADARPARFANDRAAWTEDYADASAALNNVEAVTLLRCDGAGRQVAAGGGDAAAPPPPPPAYVGAALRATRPLAAGDEVYLSYGEGYWGSQVDAQLQRRISFIDASGIGARDRDWRRPPPPPPRRAANLALFFCAATPPRLVDFGEPLPVRPASYDERLRRALEPARRLGLLQTPPA